MDFAGIWDLFCGQRKIQGFFASLRMTSKNNFNSRSPSGMTSKKGNDNSKGNSKGNSKSNGNGNGKRDASGWVDEVGGGSSDFGEDGVAAVRGEWGFGQVGGYEDGGVVWGPEDGYVVGCAVVA